MRRGSTTVSNASSRTTKISHRPTTMLTICMRRMLPNGSRFKSRQLAGELVCRRQGNGFPGSGGTPGGIQNLADDDVGFERRWDSGISATCYGTQKHQFVVIRGRQRSAGCFFLVFVFEVDADVVMADRHQRSSRPVHFHIFAVKGPVP